ncbi:MAG: MgtC/SapB family protein [Patescibacteria group bacterium]
MLTTGEMILRLGIAALLGALIGFEREMVGKEAGVRTDIMVASGAAIFSLIGLTLPYLVATSNLDQVISNNSGSLNVIANIVVGIGFLGAGIIIQQGIHVRGLTTAASVWFVAAIGVLCGIGLTSFAAIATVSLLIILIILRKINVYELLEKKEEK